MRNIIIFGKGNMGSVIGARFREAGNAVTYVNSTMKSSKLGDIVVLAVPYPAIATIINAYKKELEGKIIVDITNPVDFETMDKLVVSADSSAAQVIAGSLPKSTVVKAFNINFAATLGSKEVGGKQPTTLHLASDSDEAKKTLTNALANSGLLVLDAGSLKRARELEAIGFLQISLAVCGQINWTGGFAIIK